MENSLENYTMDELRAEIRRRKDENTQRTLTKKRNELIQLYKKSIIEDYKKLGTNVIISIERGLQGEYYIRMVSLRKKTKEMVVQAWDQTEVCSILEGISKTMYRVTKLVEDIWNK